MDVQREFKHNMLYLGNISTVNSIFVVNAVSIMPGFRETLKRHP